MLFFVDKICDHKQNDTREHTGSIDSYISKAAVTLGDKTLDGLVHTGGENTGSGCTKDQAVLLRHKHGVKPSETGAQGGKFREMGYFSQQSTACAV